LKLRYAKRLDFTGTLDKQEWYSPSEGLYDQATKDLIRNQDKAELVIVVDRAYNCADPSQAHLVVDHINLTGDNPLVGPNDNAVGPRFPVVNNIYLCSADLIDQEETWSIGNPLGKLPTGIAAGVKAGVRLDDQEWQTVKGLGADFYCYNLVQCMILAAHRGLPVVGIALPEGAQLDEQMMIALVR
jgi:hypothetical protein